MAEISEERLAELEMLERVVQRYVLPTARDGSRCAEGEEYWIGMDPLGLSDEQVEQMMQGLAMWDHRPQGMGKKALLHRARGYLAGRLVAALNYGPDFTSILDAVANPAQYWQSYAVDTRSISQRIAAECPADAAFQERTI